MTSYTMGYIFGALLGLAVIAALGGLVLWMVGAAIFKMEKAKYLNSFLAVLVASAVGFAINFILGMLGTAFLIAPFGFSMIGIIVWGIIWGTLLLTPFVKIFWDCEPLDALKAAVTYNVIWTIIWTVILGSMLAAIGISLM